MLKSDDSGQFNAADDVTRLKEILRNNMTRRSRSAESDVLHVSLHLDQQDSYHVADTASNVNIFRHRNTLANFYLNACHPNDTQYSTITSSDSSSYRNGSVLPAADRNCTNLKHNHQLIASRNVTLIHIYQHELGGYQLRDCFVRQAEASHLKVYAPAITQTMRQQWEVLPEVQGAAWQLCIRIVRDRVHALHVPHCNGAPGRSTHPSLLQLRHFEAQIQTRPLQLFNNGK